MSALWIYRESDETATEEVENVDEPSTVLLTPGISISHPCGTAMCYKASCYSSKETLMRSSNSFVVV